MATEFDMKKTPLLKFPAQPVPETEAIPRKGPGKLITFRHRWRLYFDKFGCRSCHRKNVRHASHGLCRRCKKLVANRLRVTAAEFSRSLR
jgi:hypothetical protein